MIAPNTLSPQAFPPSAASTADILKARARLLARPTDRADVPGKTLEVTEFRLANERYAIENIFVREVVPLKELTPLPCCPDFVRGIVNVRGQIVPVFDLKKFFELPDAGIADVHMVVIVQSQGIALGIEADAVIGVRAIDLESIQPSLPTLTGVRARYLKGVTEQHVVVLDVSKILSDPKIIVDEETPN
jgi:purine-binding chemotaxis protein CheW